MHTVGIDLAAQPANTGWCVIDWDRNELLGVGVNTGGDDELLELIVAPTTGLAGIDTPLGWPDGFVQAIGAHHAGAQWPDDDGDPDGHRRRLRLRRTDEVVAVTTGRHPMSVSADRIAVAAMRGARLQQLVVDRLGTEAVDRSGCSGRMAETYPAAALAVWDLPAAGYKGSGGVDARTRILAALLDRFGLDVGSGHQKDMVASDHLLDAFVCALVAAAVLAGATARPGGDERGPAGREGWIHVPDAGWLA